MRKFGLSLLAAAAFFSMASSAHADLTGDTVDVQYLYPNISTTVADVGNAVVPGSVFYTPGGGTMEITVTGNLVTITNNGTGVDFQTPAGANPFNGFSVSDLTQNPGIVGVTFLQGASTVPSNFMSGPGAEVTTYSSSSSSAPATTTSRSRRPSRCSAPGWSVWASSSRVAGRAGTSGTPLPPDRGSATRPPTVNAAGSDQTCWFRSGTSATAPSGCRRPRWGRHRGSASSPR